MKFSRAGGGIGRERCGGRRGIHKARITQSLPRGQRSLARLKSLPHVINIIY